MVKFEFIKFLSSKLGWTEWDKIELQGPLTLREVKRYINDNYKVDISSLLYKEVILFYEDLTPEEE